METLLAAMAVNILFQGTATPTGAEMQRIARCVLAQGQISQLEAEEAFARRTVPGGVWTRAEIETARTHMVELNRAIAGLTTMPGAEAIAVRTMALYRDRLDPSCTRIEPGCLLSLHQGIAEAIDNYNAARPLRERLYNRMAVVRAALAADNCAYTPPPPRPPDEPESPFDLLSATDPPPVFINSGGTPDSPIQVASDLDDLFDASDLTLPQTPSPPGPPSGQGVANPVVPGGSPPVLTDPAPPGQAPPAPPTVAAAGAPIGPGWAGAWSGPIANVGLREGPLLTGSLAFLSESSSGSIDECQRSGTGIRCRVTGSYRDPQRTITWQGNIVATQRDNGQEMNMLMTIESSTVQGAPVTVSGNALNSYGPGAIRIINVRRQ